MNSTGNGGRGHSVVWTLILQMGILCSATYAVAQAPEGSKMALVPYGSKMALVADEGYGTLDPYRYVRVSPDGSIYIAPIDGMTENDATNAEFRKVNGLSRSDCISFESTKYPGKFLRHTNYQIRLQARPWLPAAWFDDSATFCLTVPQGGAAYGYQSFNVHDYYIRAEGSALALRHLGYESQYPADYDAAIFHEEPGPVTLKLYTGGSLSWAAWIMRDGDYQVLQYGGACTGLQPWWGPPPTSTMSWWLRYYGDRTAWPPYPWRRVDSTATGSYLYGFYPVVRLYMPFVDGMTTTTDQGWVAKIETGSAPCVW